MKRFAFMLVLLCGTSLMTFAQVGQKFPEVEGKLLSGKEAITLPEAASGKVTIIGVAYSKKSDDDLNKWYKPMYYQFVSPPKTEGPDILGGIDYPEKVNLYFVGMIKGVAKAASGKIINKMQKNIDEKFHDNIVVYDGGGVKDYINELDMGEKSEPYFFLLDADGKIVHATHGAYSEKKMQQIVSKVDDMLW